MREVWEGYAYTIIGALSGFIIALTILTVGFFKTLLIVILIVLGALVGWAITNTELGVYLHKKNDRLKVKERNGTNGQ